MVWSFLPLVLLASNPFVDFQLNMAFDIVEEAEELAFRKEHEQASITYREGLHLARPRVLKLQDEDASANEDDFTVAFDWLVSSYCASSACQLEAGNLNGARSDAWAACVFTQNTNNQALQAMLQVCQASTDKIGELTTLKSILALSSSSRDTTSPMDKRILELERELGAK
jgi:hypothetical protein